MTVAETIVVIKSTIAELTENVTEKNASAITSSLIGLGEFVHQQLSAPDLRNHYDQLARNAKDKMKLLEESNKALVAEIASTEILLRDQEEIENTHEQLIAEQESRRLLLEKAEAINGLSKLKAEVQNLSRLNIKEMEEQIKNLEEINTVLVDAHTELERHFAASVLTVEKNLSALHSSKIVILEKISPVSLETLEGRFSDDVRQLASAYNNYVSLVNEHRENQEHIVALYKGHHAENENIREALEKKNESLKGIESLNQQFKELSQKYDDEIKSLVEKRDHLPIYQLPEVRKYL